MRRRRRHAPGRGQLGQSWRSSAGAAAGRRPRGRGREKTPRSWTRRRTTRVSAPHMCRLQPRWGRAVARDRRRPIAADLNRHGVHDAGEWLRRRQRVQGLGFFPFFLLFWCLWW
ncbi:extensin precursor [Iris pallida]|uniref:Extensin n=1 Tax=Iris pallida TaxID=29817 RepID=A0AAX6HRC9_IRIPA|nr:extensin precursor [Iris pallida]